MIEKLKLRGHIIDSLILSKLLNKLSDMGVHGYTADVKIGTRREDLSEATFVIETEDEELMTKAIKYAKKHGAMEI